MPTEIEQEIAPHVRVMQIICLGLAGGPLLFAGVLLFGGLGHEGDPEPRFLSLVGLIMAGSVLVIGPVIRKAVSGSAKPMAGFEGSETLRRVGAYQTGLITASALNEGAAFLNLIAFMIDGSPWNFALAALLVVVNVMKFPTVGGVAAWIQAKQRSQREEEQLAR